jgi:hypothetical protein
MAVAEKSLNVEMGAKTDETLSLVRKYGASDQLLFGDQRP